MSQLPLYKVIYKELTERILSGSLMPGGHLPTEEELARHYGVSRITVRHALTMMMDQGMISRVQGRGSVVAEPARGRKLLGLAMGDFDSAFGMELIKGIQQEALRRGYLVILQTGYTTLEQEGQVLQDLIRAGVCGIVHIPLYDAMHYTSQLQSVVDQVPLVFADRRVVGIDAPLVSTDNAGGTAVLYRFLAEKGHSHIAFVSGKADSTVIGERIKGFTDESSNRNLVLNTLVSTMPDMCSLENEQKDIERIALFLCKNKEITAIIAHTYRIAKLVCRAVESLKLQIPENISLVCFDYPDDQGCGQCYAHMHQRERQIGVTAVDMLLTLLGGSKVPDVVRIPADFVDGNSYCRL